MIHGLKVCMTSEELKLLSNIRDFTNLFYMILGSKSSRKSIKTENINCNLCITIVTSRKASATMYKVTESFPWRGSYRAINNLVSLNTLSRVRASLWVPYLHNFVTKESKFWNMWFPIFYHSWTVPEDNPLPPVWPSIKPSDISEIQVGKYYWWILTGVRNPCIFFLYKWP